MFDNNQDSNDDGIKVTNFDDVDFESNTVSKKETPGRLEDPLLNEILKSPATSDRYREEVNLPLLNNQSHYKDVNTNSFINSSTILN